VSEATAGKGAIATAIYNKLVVGGYGVPIKVRLLSANGECGVYDVAALSTLVIPGPAIGNCSTGMQKSYSVEVVKVNDQVAFSPAIFTSTAASGNTLEILTVGSTSTAITVAVTGVLTNIPSTITTASVISDL